MFIDRERVKSVFAEYAKNYDAENPKVALKIVHTYKVSELCESIAKSLNLSKEDIDLAWLIGMLHDIGRFEQLRRYNTFADASSISHALLGKEILFGDNIIRDYVDDASEDEIIKEAVLYHSDYRLPKDLDDRSLMFCQIIRDADKIDIIRVQLDTPLEDIYDCSTYDLKHDEVSRQVLQGFFEEHAIERKIRKTTVDYVVSHISLTYELVYKKSKELMREQGHIFTLMDFVSDNPVTNRQFDSIRKHMREYLSR